MEPAVPSAYPRGQSVTFRCTDLRSPVATMQNPPVKPEQDGWDGRKRDICPELPVNLALPCWHFTPCESTQVHAHMHISPARELHTANRFQRLPAFDCHMAPWGATGRARGGSGRDRCPSVTEGVKEEASCMWGWVSGFTVCHKVLKGSIETFWWDRYRLLCTHPARHAIKRLIQEPNLYFTFTKEVFFFFGLQIRIMQSQVILVFCTAKIKRWELKNRSRLCSTQQSNHEQAHGGTGEAAC